MRVLHAHRAFQQAADAVNDPYATGRSTLGLPIRSVTT